MSGPSATLLRCGRRLHLQHGPIDLVIEAWGTLAETRAAYRQATAAFDGLLENLVADLDILRTPVGGKRAMSGQMHSLTAERMAEAAMHHAPAFVTPMAAVAGAVADTILQAMVVGRQLERAYVNNGGDIAMMLTPGTEITAAAGPGLADQVRVQGSDPVRGIATSGWRGRSHSLGIADAVTVLAATAAEADIAATLIAGAVDLPGHASIQRRPAVEISPDSDLGDRNVTTAVGTLSIGEVELALSQGARCAEEMVRRRQITGAALWLQGRSITCGLAPDQTARKDLIDA